MAEKTDMNALIRRAAGRPAADAGEDVERLVITTDGDEVREDDLFPWERIDGGAMVNRAIRRGRGRSA